MLKFILKRLAYTLAVIVIATLFVFVLSRQSGDPRHLFLSEMTSQKQWDDWGRDMGLDRPVIVQYWLWLGKAARGDFGESVQQRRPALDVVVERVPATLELAAGAFIFAIVTGMPLGVLSAVWRGSILDYAARTFALLGQALPVFWLGLLLILFFSVRLDWLPTSRRGGIDHLILPSISLGWLFASSFLRLTRSAMLEVLDSEFIKLARAKGVSGRSVIWKHAFRNALIPTLTFAGLLIAALITGAVVTETVFSWPGLGQLAVNSVFQLDFPVMTTIVFFITLGYLAMALLIDLAYAFIDPRIRYA